MTETANHDEYAQMLALRISGLVEASPLTRKDIAASVGLTPARMRRKLRGESRLMVTDVFAFSRVLQIDAAELIAA